jgi:hypothetical protein
MAGRLSLRLGRVGCARLAIAALCGLGALAAGFSPVHAGPPARTQASVQTSKRSGAPHRWTDSQLAYRLPPGLQDGRCRPEMFDPSTATGLGRSRRLRRDAVRQGQQRARRDGNRLPRQRGRRTPDPRQHRAGGGDLLQRKLRACPGSRDGCLDGRQAGRPLCDHADQDHADRRWPLLPRICRARDLEWPSGRHLRHRLPAAGWPLGACQLTPLRGRRHRKEMFPPAVCRSDATQRRIPPIDRFLSKIDRYIRFV